MSNAVRERMIPILPCRSIDDQLAFYQAIGFEVTYRQKVPNVYAAVERGMIELHLLKAWILRADVAMAMGDEALAASLLAKVGQASLDEVDRASLADELARADDLRAALR